MNKFTYSMLHFNTFLFDSQIQFWPFKLFFTEMIVFPAVLLLIVVFVYPHGIYSEPPCMSLGQKNNPKCKFCFTSVLCRYLWEMAVLCNKVSRTHIFIKRGVDKPFLYSNALLFPSVLVLLHCSAHKERKLPPELLASQNNFIVQHWRLMVKVFLSFFLSFCTNAIQFLSPSSRSCDL